jgi:allantoinase
VVRPGKSGAALADIAVKAGRIVRVGRGLPPAQAKRVHDGQGLLAFPGLVDANVHLGVYAPLEEDAASESRAMAQGGVTTSLCYVRDGQPALEANVPYAQAVPALLGTVKGRFHTDYAFHLGPLDRRHLDELELLVGTLGVSSFQAFASGGGIAVPGAPAEPRQWREGKLDLAYLEAVMRALRRVAERFPERRGDLSLGLHCEAADLVAAYARGVTKDGKPAGLHAHGAAHPPHAEAVAIAAALQLAQEVECPAVNLLALSTRRGLSAALALSRAYPQLDVRREVSIAHLCLDHDAPAGALAKVNPPLRPREDVEALWQALLDGQLHWVSSNHTCCRHELKLDPQRPTDVLQARAGFGSAEYLLTALISEGRRRGMDWSRVAEVTSWNPARRFGLHAKGDLAPGFDADVVLVDPDRNWTIHGVDSESTQGYTPFEGLPMTAKVITTFLRGQVIWDKGRIIGAPRGRYLSRPYRG